MCLGVEAEGEGGLTWSRDDAEVIHVQARESIDADATSHGEPHVVFFSLIIEAREDHKLGDEGRAILIEELNPVLRLVSRGESGTLFQRGQQHCFYMGTSYAKHQRYERIGSGEVTPVRCQVDDVGDKNWLRPGSLRSENFGSKNCVLLYYCACVMDACIAFLEALDDEVCSVTKWHRKRIQVSQGDHAQLAFERRLNRPHFTTNNQSIET